MHLRIVETMPSSRPVALITGAARRLGREIAIDLAGHGFDVALHFKTSEVEAQATRLDAEATGARAACFQADLAVEAECRALVPRVLAHFDRLDVVINSASIYRHDSVASFSMTAMEDHWRANVAPAVLLAHALHEHLQDREKEGRPAGCVVNLLDQKLWGLHPAHFSYTLSKAALQAATVMLAQALAPRVRVCGVAPGLTLPSGGMTEQEFAAAQRHTPLHRTANAADIARSVRFMVESPAVTGTTLVVDGGQHLAVQARDAFFVLRDPVPAAPSESN